MKTNFHRGGAPQKPEAEKRERMVQVRFRQDEFTKLEHLRATTTSRDLSSFIRAVYLEKPLFLKTPTDTTGDIILSLLREIREDMLRIGSNINQSARRINSTTDYQNLQYEVNQMTTNMGKIDAQLGQLIGQISDNYPSQKDDSMSDDYANQ